MLLRLVYGIGKKNLGYKYFRWKMLGITTGFDYVLNLKAQNERCPSCDPRVNYS